MLTRVHASGYTIRGISVGGVYTSLRVDELNILLDVGMAARTFATTDAIFLSHGHADHIGSLVSSLGIRALHGKKHPPKVYLPEEISETVLAQLAIASKMQRYELAIQPVPLKPGDEQNVRDNLWVRAFRTHHPVPSLGFQFFRRVKKLKPEYQACRGEEIRDRRMRGEELFDTRDNLEVAYATDTLLRVMDTAPEILRSKVLILECTFLDGRKSLEASRKGCHVHLDELLERADAFENEALVLMHFSQLYSPRDVHKILAERLPPSLAKRVVAFAPRTGGWPG